jgi:hypothetical protein
VAVKPTFGVTLGRDTAGAGAGLGGAYSAGTGPDYSLEAGENAITAADPSVAAGNAAIKTILATGQTDPTNFAADWYKAFFGQYGLPGDVQASIVDILKQYAADPTTAQTLAQQYLRTTPWFQSTFPGFSSGVTNGLFTDETGYRSYLNSVNNVYNQYTGRHVSGDELTALLKEGANPQLVANRFQGQAWVNANGNDSQYLAGAFGDGRLTPDQLTAAGNESAGIDTAQGQAVQLMLQKATQRAQSVFSGVLARPATSQGPNGPVSPGLRGASGSTSGSPDVAS